MTELGARGELAFTLKKGTEALVTAFYDNNNPPVLIFSVYKPIQKLKENFFGCSKSLLCLIEFINSNYQDACAFYCTYSF